MSGASTPSAGWDFGDAPDPGFPSLLASEGARHFVVHFEWLGEGVSQELDSQQVDADLYDDGVEVGELLTCQEAAVQVTVSVADRGDPQHPYDGQHLLYLNVLVDWDGDGSWGGEESCPGGLAAPEWAVRNLPIDVSSWPQGITSTVVPVEFMVGQQAGETWARFTLSYGQVVSGDDWEGRGSFTFGETEDHPLVVSPSGTAVPTGPASSATAAVGIPPGAAENPNTTAPGAPASLPCLGAALPVGIGLAGALVGRRRSG
jgi:hypothetical protein